MARRAARRKAEIGCERLASSRILPPKETDMSMTVELGALEPVVEEWVANGVYGSRDEALQNGVRLLLEVRQAKLAELKAKLQVGLDDIAAGRVVSAEEVFAEFEALYGKLDDE
jgi:antitoxin ParD1/3/4